MQSSEHSKPLYSKRSYSIEDQIIRLKEKRLQFRNENEATHFFQYNNYYKWKGYAYDFQDHEDENHPFKDGIYFEEITNIYNFDRELRSLIFSSIERIETALKSQIIYQYCLQHGSHWYLNSELFRDKKIYLDSIKTLFGEVSSSKETFIKHYLDKYDKPTLPPSWSCLEIVSLGFISKFFKNLKADDCKKKIAQDFRLADPKILDNWIQCISIIRNICAHHGRLWGKNFMPIMNLKKPSNVFASNIRQPHDLYASVCCIKYLLDIIDKNNDFTKKIEFLINKYPSLDINQIGFQDEWNQDIFWK